MLQCDICGFKKDGNINEECPVCHNKKWIETNLNTPTKISNNKLVICPRCVNDMKDKEYTSPMQFRGFFVNYKVPEDMICPKCKSQLKTTSLTIDEYKAIFNTSHNTDFIQAMMDLKEKDIIEFELKMSQFKKNMQDSNSQSSYSAPSRNAQSSAKVWSAPQNVPKCPTCGSTNIHKISVASKAGSVALWGIFSRKVHKQWHCNNCKSEW